MSNPPVIQYLNTDLDLVCDVDPAILAAEFEARDLVANVTRGDDGLFYVLCEDSNNTERSRTSCGCWMPSMLCPLRAASSGIAVQSENSMSGMTAAMSRGHSIKDFPIRSYGAWLSAGRRFGSRYIHTNGARNSASEFELRAIASISTFAAADSIYGCLDSRDCATYHSRIDLQPADPAHLTASHPSGL